MTSAVSRRSSAATARVSTPSRVSSSRMKRPKWSAPTRVISAAFSPSRAAPIAVLVGEPPTYLANEPMSSSRPPTCSP